MLTSLGCLYSVAFRYLPCFYKQMGVDEYAKFTHSTMTIDFLIINLYWLLIGVSILKQNNMKFQMKQIKAGSKYSDDRHRQSKIIISL